MKKVANVIGSSGLVGKQLVTQLFESPGFETVRSFARRPSGIAHPKLEEIIIDFDQPSKWKHLVTGDVLFSSLGTTIKTAKTKENQYRVDYTYQYEFAKAAAENGIAAYILVSSIGANPKSSVFYSRMKGELENAVSRLPFRKSVIFRPSMLDGNRLEKRVGEKFWLVFSKFLTKFILRKYRPTPVDILATKMIQTAQDQTSGSRFIEGLEIF